MLTRVAQIIAAVHRDLVIVHAQTYHGTNELIRNQKTKTV